MIGQTLGGRYELLARIGGGGMALVYKARDILLNRFVAVKVLRQQFANDDDFVRRFRREAQAAASLSHPNIVSIYDVGQEDDTHYIVMELVEGHNLNEIIRDRAPLQVEEAVRIAAQICDALDHAHHNQIIHRDIKPHNILIGNNGRVKVTDFGIARAVTSSTITQTGSVVGSVHYFSPEHAKGVTTGEKSDIYSLGIVLYQMLTGRLPFLGESPISVALKHLQESFEDPRIVNPHIPQSVENVILKAMRKNPQERYASARAMLGDLETCLQPQRLHEPRVQFASEYEGEDKDGEEATRVIPALKPDMRMSSEETVAKSSSRKRELAAEEEEPRRRWVLPTVLGVIAVILIGILIWAISALNGALKPNDVQVPDVTGSQYEEAKAELEALGLKVMDPPIKLPSDEYDPNEVMDQDRKNMTVKEGSTITLTVSTGPELSVMPDVSGESYETAVEQLKAHGVDESRITKGEEVYDDASPGTVLDQEPKANAEFDPKTAEIVLTVSKGPESVEMPDLIGKTLEEAKAILLQNNLTLDEDALSYEPSFTPKGQVFKQFPVDPGKQVDVGTAVKLWISNGYPEGTKEKWIDVTVPPAEDGKESTIRITVNDETGEDIERVAPQKIKSATTFRVLLVMLPDTQGVIKIYRDKVQQEEIPVPYEDQPLWVSPFDPPAADDPIGGLPFDTGGQGGDGNGGGQGQGGQHGGQESNPQGGNNEGGQ
ncbi:Stk1 family PASTA domain-containing Ser/Thr kinase [Cohnella lubricantis]|uniref:Serine/threonine-protein kinase PrkC n=1 Tax=Cohnella lubricantis TaxID=2163172 RepID=A0A841T796_9BACL|nr:Stk1 family PASTA domain-containing Ser/Thr kinase [Cohnella lubricantis]MBB6677204.1 Stk1 family PASTA domain-containing Ser/Thr kinase [Cohnella lubricantis]MBP2116986.1 serine/threonine-protein kinase [Cohnella lubricantis]